LLIGGKLTQEGINPQLKQDLDLIAQQTGAPSRFILHTRSTGKPAALPSKPEAA
jgi:hypothetical protein